MTFFVDANVIVYSRTRSSPYHEQCADIVEAVARGDARGRTSVAALEEVWHAETSGKVGDLSGLTERAYAVFAPLLSVTDNVFRLALSTRRDGLGTNDRIHVATCITNDIRTIVSADAAFNGVEGLRRIDPLDRPAIRALLTADPEDS